MDRDDLGFLYDAALDYGIEFSQRHLNLFRIYLDELFDWNRRMNLTGLSTRERTAIELLLDSLIPAHSLPDKGRLLDVGSGAGFPGIPIKIYSPQLKIHLMEPNSKKVSFLRHVIRLLKLDEIEVVKGRIEMDGDKLNPIGYQLITTRALANLGQTIAWCSPFLLPNGLFIVFLGSHADEDLKKSQQIMEEYHLTVNKIIPYSLPGKRSKRNTVIFKKKA